MNQLNNKTLDTFMGVSGTLAEADSSQLGPLVSQKKVVSSMKIQLKWEWGKSKEHDTIHNYASIVGTLINVHYSTDSIGLVHTDSQGRGYYVYWNDDNRDDEYFSNLGQVEYEIIKYLIKNGLEDGLQRIEGGK